MTSTAFSNFDLSKLLQDRFSLATFRKGQREIIESVLAGQDALAVLPTGGGKSLCYQLPAQATEQLVIVVSPLIALMKDQVMSLQKKGLRAGCLHSAQSQQEKREVFQEMARGGAFILYLSPERVQREGFQNWLKTQKIALIAIDEAHCVSQWGHDFRAEYGQLKIFKTLRPEIPILALTASATPLVLADIAKNLQQQKPARHIHGFYRPNLYYQVECCADEELKAQFLVSALRRHSEGRIIVYCGTRQLTEDLSRQLLPLFPKVACYHAGLSSDERHQTQTAFETGEVRILVATNAFGMGIDHPDIRLVVHFNMPGNIDSLYQEMGRAGRDGEPATCLMLYSGKDKGLQSFFIQSSQAPAEIKRSRWNTLNAIVDYAEGSECRHAEILTYYKDSQRLQKCGHCDSCAPQSDRRIAKPKSQVVLRSSPTKLRPKQRQAQARLRDEPLSELQQLQFEMLREWRKAKAAEFDVPAFVIFSDRSLKEIAALGVHQLQDLKAVHGMGDVKLERFGRDILRVLGETSP